MDVDAAPAPPPPPPTTTRVEFVVGPFLPDDAAAAAAPAPDGPIIPPPGAPGAPAAPAAAHPPPTARLPDAVLAAASAKLVKGGAGLAGEEGERVLRRVFGERLPWRELYE